MRRHDSRWELLAFGVAFSFCVLTVLKTAPVWSESLDTEPAPGPLHKWSNDSQIRETVAKDGCGDAKVAPAYRAEYQAGVDSRGRAFAPPQSTPDWRMKDLEVSVGVANGQASDSGSGDGHHSRKRHGRSDRTDQNDEGDTDNVNAQAQADVQAYASLSPGKDQDCSSSFK